MNKVPIISKLLILAGLCAIQAPADDGDEAPPPGREAALTFVYIHGFGGVKESPQFCDNLREFFDGEGVPADVINYEWDSVKVDVLQAGASWLKAQERADAEAPRFKREVIDKLERDGRAYVLVGFSVGSRVVLGALEACTVPLRGVRGIYFLGSAMTKETTLTNRSALPPGMKITNYHSPLRDVVHRMAFNFMSATPGGGQVGFDDVKVFDNHPVSCSHAHKGIGIATDYSGLAEAIASIELYEGGQIISGRTKVNWETPVMEGKLWWNKIKTLRVDDPSGGQIEVELEQHTMRPGYFRAVGIDADGDRTRLARGDNLHAILAKLGVAPGRGSEGDR